jgi:hypothetical protein
MQTQEQIDFLREAEEAVRGDNDQSYFETREVMIDGVKTIEVIQTNFHSGDSSIDGHYWIESDEGDILYEESAMKNIFKTPAWKNGIRADPNCFLFYNRIANSALEQQIIETETAKQMEKWGGKERHDTILRKVNTDKQYGCFQNALRNRLLHGGNLRFGALGIASPRMREVYWVFGHPDNKKYEEWIVPKGKDEVSVFGDAPVSHTRTTPFVETPTIFAVQDKLMTTLREKEAHVRREGERAKALEMMQKEQQAKAAEEALLALLEQEEKPKRKQTGKGKGKGNK